MPQDDVDVQQIENEKSIRQTAQALREHAVEIQQELYAASVRKERFNQGQRDHLESVQASRQKFMKINEHGKEITLLQDVLHTADNYLNQGSSSQYNALTYQLETVKFIKDFYAAMHGLFSIKSSEYKVAIQDLRASERLSNVILPERNFSVTVGDEGKLEIELIFSDLAGKPEEEKNPAIEQRKQGMQGKFNELITLWLKQNGYTNPDQASIFKDEHGNPLTKDDLNDLKQDAEKGLDKFLKTVSDLKFVDQSPPSVSPTPT